MPDVQEVFRMSTQKVRQDPGAMERQLTRQRKAARNRKLGAFAVVGCIGAALIVAAVVASGQRSEPAPSVAAEPGGTRQTLSIVDVGSGSATAFTAPLGASEFDVTLDGSMVTYTDLDENGNDQVFVMDADGSNARQLTHGGRRLRRRPRVVPRRFDDRVRAGTLRATARSSSFASPTVYRPGSPGNREARSIPVAGRPTEDRSSSRP